MGEVVTLLSGALIGFIIANIIYNMKLRELKQTLDTLTVLVKEIAHPEVEASHEPVYGHALNVNSISQLAGDKLVHEWWVGNK